MAAGLSADWFADVNVADWGAYYGSVGEDGSAYGSAASIADRLNHLATHNLFSAVLNVFLGNYARVVADAQGALDQTFGEARHEPHYALFLAFVRLLEHARNEANSLTGKHLDFYYRQILHLKERQAVPGNVHLLVELAKPVAAHTIEARARFRAGKDARGRDAFFAADRDLVANRAQVVERRTVYRHLDAPDEALPFQDGRLFASPAADSDDGRGAPLTSPDHAWHPFFAKTFENGALTAIRMPPAEIGFAVASHYLWLAEGTRTITVDVTTATATALPDLAADVTCLLTSEKGWLEKQVTTFTRIPDGPIRLTVDLTGEDPAITSYVPKAHGFSFDTDLPMLIVKLRHRPDALSCYPLLQDLVITQIEVRVEVDGLRTLALSNDFGPVDAAKPFQPYGPAPAARSAFIVGSRELFQKHVTDASLEVTWMTTPRAYQAPATTVRFPKGQIPPKATVAPEAATSPEVAIEALVGGSWVTSLAAPVAVAATSYDLTAAAGITAVDAPDPAANERFSTSSRHGFVRLVLSSGLGQEAYAVDLVDSIVNKRTKPDPPVLPTMRSLALHYEATQTLVLDSAPDAEALRQRGRIFHVTPFGHAEQQPVASGVRTLTLLPRFLTDGAPVQAELYLGIAGLHPPQNLALLVQVVDGTANPLAAKPPAHVRWSYLRDNEWVGFADDTVDDGTDGLLESGIVTLAVPADASEDNTVLPSGRHWVRAAVQTSSDAVCRLMLVAAQGLRATFIDQSNDPAFPATPLAPSTISKLERPDAAVKAITQPFPGFGGRGAESGPAFHTRVSERLRHKDRAIALWDYERLVLEAFPAIYRVRCLNHTRYEPNVTGTGIYRELAPGHVTVVTIPVGQAGDRRDPLRPFTSLGLLSRIQEFLTARMPCFVTLHVRNPQFEEVWVDFRVRLRAGFDETFHVKRLQEEITRFLSPWAFVDAASPTFTSRFHKSALIDFVEERPYVDYVTDFGLFHRYLERSATGDLVEVVSPDADEVTGSRAISILVSVPAAKQVITVIHPDEDEVSTHDCPCEVRT